MMSSLGYRADGTAKHTDKRYTPKNPDQHFRLNGMVFVLI